jgi:hypothetical protein
MGASIILAEGAGFSSTPDINVFSEKIRLNVKLRRLIEAIQNIVDKDQLPFSFRTLPDIISAPREIFIAGIDRGTTELNAERLGRFS